MRLYKQKSGKAGSEGQGFAKFETCTKRKSKAASGEGTRRGRAAATYLLIFIKKKLEVTSTKKFTM